MLSKVTPEGQADPMEPVAPGPIRLIPYAGDVLRVLGESPGLALCELTVPPGFAGPPPHIHHDFDEAIYVLTGAPTMTRGQAEAGPAPAGTLILLAPRGVRHTFANPTDEPARVLGVWRPASVLTFMEEIGAALRPPVRPTRTVGGDLPTPQQRNHPVNIETFT